MERVAHRIEEPLRPKSATFEFAVLGLSCVYLFAAVRLIKEERDLRRAAMPVVFLSLVFPVAFRTGFPVTDFLLVTLGLLLTMKTAVLFFVRSPLALRLLSVPEFAATLLAFPASGRVAAKKAEASEGEVRRGYAAGAVRVARAGGKFVLWAVWLYVLQRIDHARLPLFWYTIFTHQCIIAGYFFLSGTFDVGNGLIGLAAPHVPLTDIFDNPWFCSSPRDFWSNRWNTGFSVLARELIFDKYRAGIDSSGRSAAESGVSGGEHSNPGTPQRAAPPRPSPSPVSAASDSAASTPRGNHSGPTDGSDRGESPAPPAAGGSVHRVRRRVSSVFHFGSALSSRFSLQERTRAAVSALAVFLYSGLMHEYLCLVTLNRTARGRHVAFFLAHYGLCMAQVALSKLLPGVRRAMPRPACVAVTWAAMIPLSPLFVSVFIEAGFLRSLAIRPEELLGPLGRGIDARLAPFLAPLP